MQLSSRAESEEGMARLTTRTDICCEPENDIVYYNPKDPDGLYNIIDLAKCAHEVDGEEANILLEISNRLAAYEDTGLTPEEVQKLKKSDASKEQCTIDQLGEIHRLRDELKRHKQAGQEGRLVVLPCKIGDEVWFLEKQLDIANGTCSTVISEYIVTEIRGNKYNPLWYMASSERCTHRDFHPTELGKTVFLTKEAAEKALGGGESD